MKTRLIIVILIVLLCGIFALSACVGGDITLGTVGGLELSTDKVVRVEHQRYYNIYKTKKSFGLSDVKIDLEARYADDKTLTVTQVNYGILAFSRKQLNKYDERLGEAWMFYVQDTELIFWQASARLVPNGNMLHTEFGLLFWPPIKHMTDPQLLYQNKFDGQLVAAYENVAYPLSCDFITLKTYYERLGVYFVSADETTKTIELKLNPSEPEVFHQPEQDYRATVKIVYIDASEAMASSSFVQGYFKATVER